MPVKAEVGELLVVHRGQVMESIEWARTVEVESVRGQSPSKFWEGVLDGDFDFSRIVVAGGGSNFAMGSIPQLLAPLNRDIPGPDEV